MKHFDKIKDMTIEEFKDYLTDNNMLEADEREYLIEWLNKDIIDWSKMPKDTKVLVRNYVDNSWKRRYFAGYDENNDKPYLVYRDGMTSWSEGDNTQPLNYKYCELVEEEITHKGCKFTRKEDK